MVVSARSRRKGAQWEREVSKKLRAIGIPAERNLTETRTGNAGDIDLPPDIPLLVQAKCGGAPRIYRALAEAVEAADGTGRVPVALIHRDGAGSRPADEIAVLQLEDFMEMVDQLLAVCVEMIDITDRSDRGTAHEAAWSTTPNVVGFRGRRQRDVARVPGPAAG